MDVGMEQCKVYPCVFGEMKDDEVTLILSVHVNGIVVEGKKADGDRLFSVLSDKFPMTTKGN